MLEINLSVFFKRQRKLDYFIHKKHKVNYQNTFFERLLALIVEISEFSNETRCFKYWSLNKKISKERTLEEYIDGLHFLFSIGLMINYTKKKIILPSFRRLKTKPLLPEIVKNILAIYTQVIKLQTKCDIFHYEKVLKKYLSLIYLFNFSMKEIIEVYIKKNKINYERQMNNY